MRSMLGLEETASWFPITCMMKSLGTRCEPSRPKRVVREIFIVNLPSIIHHHRIFSNKFLRIRRPTANETASATYHARDTE